MTPESFISLSRRRLLQFFGAGAAGALIEPVVGSRIGPAVMARHNGGLNFTPVRLPHPLPIYQREESFFASGIGTGSILPPAEDTRLFNYTVIDDIVIPPEYERYVIVRWGDRPFPNPDDYFGYNCDYTGFVSMSDDEEEGFLWVNHEYESYPISTMAPGIADGLAGAPTSDRIVLGFPLPVGSNPLAPTLAERLAGLSPAQRRLLYGEFYYNLGGSILMVTRRNSQRRFKVVAAHHKNRRLHALSGLAINAERTDGYASITSWGNAPHQRGDRNYLIGTGPAATQVFPLSSDGLGNRIIGLGFNCAGATTPWGTIMSAEENFQGGTAGASPFFMGVQENVLPNGTQTGYLPTTSGVIASGTEFGQVGEKYGWMVEIDPADPDFRSRKHTSLGRFRHESVALRVEHGKRLVAYLGDDRRGGHIWKYVSQGVVRDRRSRANSALLGNGVLHVAKFNANGTGRWIPLTLSTRVNPVAPSDIGSAELAQRGIISRNANTHYPRRAGIAGQTQDGGSVVITTAGVGTLTETQALDSYRTLGGTKPAGSVRMADYYTTQGAVLCDAFLAANLVGGSPSARPEDIELNPRNPREAFISFTDGAPGGDGYPDSRVFQVSKTTPAVNGTQQSGGLYNIREDSADSTGLSFHWFRLEQGGEAGSRGGSGFAAIDNLAFDSRAAIWGCTDMGTDLHNGFSDGVPNEPLTIDHTATGDVSNFVGVFGANWLFVIPTEGDEAGEVIPFAYGPPRCEITGPTFVGNTLILSVQHPGEDCLFTPPALLNRDIEMLNLDGSLFTQNRTVPRGSNWPSNLEGIPAGPPRPSVIGIVRRRQSGEF
jgi:uncharacterized protein